MPLRFSAIALSAVLILASCATGSQQTPSASSSAAPPSSVAPPPTTSTPAPTGPAVFTPVIGAVLAPPIPVAADDGKTHIAYELQLTNTMSQEVTLASLTAMAADKALLTLSGDGLANRLRALGHPAQPPTPSIGPSQSVLVWLDVAVDEGAGIPTNITHRISLMLPQPAPPLTEPTMTETVAPTTVDSSRPVTISPPLKGAGWLNGDGCCGMSAHRMAANPINGQLWCAERYAIDFVQLTADGRLYNGDKAKVDSYPYYGADVTAVADGTVVAVVDNLADQVPGAKPPALPLDQYAGNRVIQDLGGGNFAMYAHIKPGSVAVKVGDRVKTGQRLGALGNSGNSDAPHLHFQLMSTQDPLRANGLPFLFDKFYLDSRVAANALDQLADTGGPADLQHNVNVGDRRLMMPLDLDVMTFKSA